MTLRLRLVAIIGLSLATLWSVVAVWMFMDVRQQLQTALDERLAASARMVAGLLASVPAEHLRVGTKPPLPLDVVARDGLACEVSLLRGEVGMQPIARTAVSPGLEDAAAGYSTRDFGGKLWRTYVLQDGGLRIATADRMDVRAALLRNIGLTASVPFMVALAVSMVLLWFGVGHGLQPIDRIRAALVNRPADTDMPLPQIQAPAELRPLINTIGQLLHRVQEAIARERRFTDDAAHELRTPLTAIKTHLEVLRLSCRDRVLDPATAEALANAQSGVARLQHTLDQLLLLARLEEPPMRAEPCCVDALHAARLAVVDASAGHTARIELQAPKKMISVLVPEALLISALRNLLDNALRHAPAGTVVVLQFARSDAAVQFSVLDKGPGMSQADRARATERFWRRSMATTGSGLGLSIVEAIAKRYGGCLELLERDGNGLEARLSLPAL